MGNHNLFIIDLRFLLLFILCRDNFICLSLHLKTECELLDSEFLGTKNIQHNGKILNVTRKLYSSTWKCHLHNIINLLITYLWSTRKPSCYTGGWGIGLTLHHIRVRSRKLINCWELSYKRIWLHNSLNSLKLVLEVIIFNKLFLTSEYKSLHVEQFRSPLRWRQSFQNKPKIYSYLSFYTIYTNSTYNAKIGTTNCVLALGT